MTAPAVTVLEQNAGTGATLTTASIAARTTPALYLLHLNYGRGSSTSPVIPSAVTGAGLTWAALPSRGSSTQTGAAPYPGGELSVYDSSGASRHGDVLFAAFGTPTGGAVTVTNGWTVAAAELAQWSLLKIENVWARGTITPLEALGRISAVSFVSGTNPSDAESCTTAAVMDALLWLGVNEGSATYTASTGWTTVASRNDTPASAFGTIVVATAAGDTASATARGTWSSSVQSRGWTIELLADDSPAGLVTGTWGTPVGGSSVATYTATWPTGYTPTDNDLAIFTIHGKGYASADPSAVSAGWTLLHNLVTGTPSPRLLTYYKVLTAGDAAPSASFSSSWQNGGLGSAYVAVGVFRGITTSSPIAASSAGTSASFTTAGVNPETATAADSGDILVNIVGGYRDASSVVLEDTARTFAKGWVHVGGSSAGHGIAIRPSKTGGDPPAALWYVTPTTTLW